MTANIVTVTVTGANVIKSVGGTTGANVITSVDGAKGDTGAQGPQGIPGEDGVVVFSETLAGDLDYSGITVLITVGENVVHGDFLYKKLSDNKYYKAKADSVLTAPATRIALATALADASCLCLLPGGIARNDTWNWTDDGTVLGLYLSSVIAGDLTESLESPPPVNSIAQIVAIPISNNAIEFLSPSAIARF